MFENCTALQEANFPEDIYQIDDDAYRGCSSLTSVTIPDTVEEYFLGENVFSLCANLTTATVGKGLLEIPDGTFYGCGLLEEVIIPDNVIRIGQEAFYDCDSLTNLDIPNSVYSLGTATFGTCDGLETVVLPDSVRGIGEECFANCVNLESMVMSENLETVGEKAFYGCTSLGSVTLPYGCTSIFSNAFDGCTSLTDVYMTNTIEDIYEDAFINCHEDLAIHTTEDASIVINYAKYEQDTEIPLEYDYDEVYTKTVYEVDGDWEYLINEDGSATIYGYIGSDTDLVIPSVVGEEERKVVAIGDYAFLYSEEIAKVTIPDSVIRIGHSSFNTCIAMYDIIIPDSVTSIESSAFAGCFNTTIHTTVDSAAYEYAIEKKMEYSIQVTEIVFDSNEITIKKDEGAYLEPTVKPEQATDQDLSWSTSDESVVSVEDYGYITGVKVGTATITATAKDGSGVSAQCKVTVVEDSDESGTGNTDTGNTNTGNTQNTVTDPNNGSTGTVTQPTPQEEKKYPAVGTKFQDNKKAKYVIIKAADAGAEIAYASPKNKKVTSITIPKTVSYEGVTYKVTTISANAFKNCKKLKKVTIGTNITAIGKKAFNNCKKLKTITIKSKKLKTIGKSAFKGISAKAVIKVPKSKKKAYKKLLKGKGQSKKVKIK